MRDRLHGIGKTQVWLIKQLSYMNITVQPPELSAILSGVLTNPKSQKVLEMSDKIISAEEKRLCIK